MPINELEQHPYLDEIDYTLHEKNYFEGLIIGTFPVYSITNTINPHGIPVERFDALNAHMRFFYGSNRNEFWKVLSTTFGPTNPTTIPEPTQRVVNSKALLTNNKLLITDVVYKTNRKEEKAEDKYLWVPTNDEFVLKNRSLNKNIKKLLDENLSIKYLYFTATDLKGQSPMGWFREIFGNALTFEILSQVSNRVWSLNITIQGRAFIAFLLPSPAGNATRGIHYGSKRKLQMFINFLQSNNAPFYAEIQGQNPDLFTQIQKKNMTNLRKSFFNKCWYEAFINHNTTYDGF